MKNFKRIYRAIHLAAKIPDTALINRAARIAYQEKWSNFESVLSKIAARSHTISKVNHLYIEKD